MPPRVAPPVGALQEAVPLDRAVLVVVMLEVLLVVAMPLPAGALQETAQVVPAKLVVVLLEVLLVVTLWLKTHN